MPRIRKKIMEGASFAIAIGICTLYSLWMYYVGKGRQKDKTSLEALRERDRLEEEFQKQKPDLDASLRERKSSVANWLRQFYDDFKNRAP